MDAYISDFLGFFCLGCASGVSLAFVFSLVGWVIYKILKIVEGG